MLLKFFHTNTMRSVSKKSMFGAAVLLWAVFAVTMTKSTGTLRGAVMTTATTEACMDSREWEFAHWVLAEYPDLYTLFQDAENQAAGQGNQDAGQQSTSSGVEPTECPGNLSCSLTFNADTGEYEMIAPSCGGGGGNFWNETDNRCANGQGVCGYCSEINDPLLDVSLDMPLPNDGVLQDWQEPQGGTGYAPDPTLDPDLPWTDDMWAPALGDEDLLFPTIDTTGLFDDGTRVYPAAGETASVGVEPAQADQGIINDYYDILRFFTIDPEPLEPEFVADDQVYDDVSITDAGDDSAAATDQGQLQDVGDNSSLRSAAEGEGESQSSVESNSDEQRPGEGFWDWFMRVVMRIDSSTTPVSTTEESETVCDDLIDNDGDGMVDTNDEDCPAGASSQATIEIECTDYIDNDGDGLTDGYDSDCQNASSSNSYTGVCADLSDNDGDGATDAADRKCEYFNTEHSPLTVYCDDLIDNDGDGLFDLDDLDCRTAPYNTEGDSVGFSIQ